MPFHPEILEKLSLSDNQLNEALYKDVQDVFATMVGVDDVTLNPLQDDSQVQIDKCLTAMIGMAGIYSGLLRIDLPGSLALSFTSLMLDMEVTEINDDVTDAMGEIANMIGGSFKMHLSHAGNDIKLSTPSVVSGTDYAVSSRSKLGTVILNLRSPSKPFSISLTLEQDA